VRASFTKNERKAPSKQHVRTLQELAFSCIGQNANQIQRGTNTHQARVQFASRALAEQFLLPEDLCNDLFAYLIKQYVTLYNVSTGHHLSHRKMLTPENISLILSNSQIDSLSLERYGMTLKENAIQQISVATTLKGICTSNNTPHTNNNSITTLY
jgi:hypothetical protein